MNIIYKKSNGEIVNFIDGNVKGLKPAFGVLAFDYTGDKTETNISELEQDYLNSMQKLSKLKVYEALETLPDEMAKFTAIMQNAEFKTKWDLSAELDMTHPKTAAALALVNIDIDAVKRKIIELEK